MRPHVVHTHHDEALHLLRHAAPDQKGRNAYGSGAAHENTRQNADSAAPGRGGRGQHRHHRQPNLARNLSRSFSRQPKNVAIPPMQIRCLNESEWNYVRNCWSVTIAGYQGNAPSNISREGPTGAEGAGETAGPGRAAHGHTSNPQHAQALPARANRHVERQTAFSTRTGSRRGLAIARQALTFA